jgi:hypothetical protein
MSDTKDPKDNAFPHVPVEFRAALEAASDQQPADICDILEKVGDNAVRKECSGKQFELKSGNCSDRCETVEEPKIVPCFRLRWGNGPQDHFETDDTEIICITVCNPYSNVVLKDFNVLLGVLTAAGGAVPNQADGTPSVIIKPQFNVCYGDIPACDPQKRDQNCVSQEFVVIDRGAVPGQYKIVIFYCFEACFHKFSGRDTAVFTIDLVAS